MRRLKIYCLLLLCLVGCQQHKDSCQQREATLDDAWKVFETPQDSCRTKVWWFHGETETTREGITADLEAFKEAGVGGVVYYDQVHGNSNGAFDAFSPEWWDMLKFSAKEARRIGLSFEINLSNGYVAGGPWITKPLSMQRILASDTVVTGGGHLHCTLSRATDNESYPVALLAYPIDKEPFLTHRDVNAKVSSQDLDAQEMCYGKGRLKLRGTPSRPVNVYFTFDEDFTARSLTYRVKPRGKSRGGAMNEPGLPDTVFVSPSFIEYPPLGQLQWSKNGREWYNICDIDPIYQAGGGTWDQKTRSFSAVTARHFRLHLHDWNPDAGAASIPEIGSVVLSGQSRTDLWEEKAGLYSEYIHKASTKAGTTTLDASQMLDLTGHMHGDTLDWDAPEGDWCLMYFTHESTRTRTKHGRPNLMGLECDKLSAEAVNVQWSNYVQPIIDTLTAIGCRPDGVIMDSHEAGSQNWTGDYEEAFRLRNGFSLRPYLPILAGYIVDNQQTTDSLLKICRQTVSDLVCERYFGTLQQLADREKVSFTAQAMGNGQSMAVDNLKVKGQVSKPQGEFWAKHTHGSYDIKEASSASHLYDKLIASAEAFTDMNYGQTLAEMKRLADFAYANQINEFVVCASAYQPWMDCRPGNTANGRQYCLNRNNTYWPYSRPFWDYQARCAGMMRQGRPVTDVLVYLGDDVPVKLQTYRLPLLPKGYNFDVCTEDALLNCDITAKGYRVLVIERGVTLSKAVSDRFNKLKLSGIEVIYAPDNPLQEVAINSTTPDLTTPNDVHTREDGLYFAHRRLKDADVYFVANHSPDTYCDTLTFRSEYPVLQVWDPVKGTCCNHGAVAVTAQQSATSVGGIFTFAPWQAYFIVCCKKREATTAQTIDCQHSSHIVIHSGPGIADRDGSGIAGRDGSGFISKNGSGFISKNGSGIVSKNGSCIAGKYNSIAAESLYPMRLTINEISLDTTITAPFGWTESTNPSLKYFSGTATYTAEIDYTPSDAKHILHLEGVHDIVQVCLNGKEITTLWCDPFETDLTPDLQPGKNKLELKVTNSLVNRMTGDADLPQAQRRTYATTPLYKSTDPLHPSGLTGAAYLHKHEYRIWATQKDMQNNKQ